MTVYIEYAFLENCLLDGLLLFLAGKCVRARINVLRILLAAAVGGGEALLFPLLNLPAWSAYPVKLLGGILLVLIALKRESGKTYLLAIVAFFALTFALGGLLVALYSFFATPYVEGEGYLVESAPVSLILAGAAIFAGLVYFFGARWYRYRSLKRNLFACTLSFGGKTLRLKGFADSGNCLAFRGEPVCVISPVAALALFRDSPPIGRMRMDTVSGSRESPVFVGTLGCGGKRFEHACFTVGQVQSGEYQLILHTAFVEAQGENFRSVKGMAEQVRGK